MNIVYMGTPEFAVAPLKSIIKAGHKVTMVVTQPDKPKGRSGKLVPTPVKQAAMEYGIEVIQPEKVRDEEIVKRIKKQKPDVIVVAAYGQILPESILEIPPLGCINIHASLLPRYRGAAPIERAILDGEDKTGVTIMYMEKGLDTGDMIDSREVEITSTDTGESLHEKLSVCGAGLIIGTLDMLEAGIAKRVKQDDSLSNYAHMLTKEMGRIDFNAPADYIDRQVRALIVWPGAYTTLNGKSIKLLSVRAVNPDSEAFNNAKPGEIIEVTKKNFTIRCGEGAITVLKLLPEGKKAMDAVAYLNGNKLEPGIIVGE